MHTVACPYRCPVWRSKLLKRGLSRTKEFAKVDYTVLRTSAIQNRTVDPWKRARPQNTCNVSQLPCSLPVLKN
jgi:hypothetical protein